MNFRFAWLACLLIVACGEKPEDTQVGDEDQDGYTLEQGDCDDDNAANFPGAGGCPCLEGFVDCDGDDANGCETAWGDVPAEDQAAGCCNPIDLGGNSLDDCDGDGHCECYGSCGDEGLEDPDTRQIENWECDGE